MAFRFVFALVLASTMAVSFTGCGNNGGNGADNTPAVSRRLNLMANNFYDREHSSSSGQCYASVNTDAVAKRVMLTGHGVAGSSCPLVEGDTVTFDCQDNMICDNPNLFGDNFRAYKYSLILVSDSSFTLIQKAKMKDDPNEYTKEFSFTNP